MTWLAGNSATLTKETATPYEGSKYLRVAHNGVTNPFAYQLVMELNETYDITGVARSDGTAIPEVVMTSKGGPVWTGTISADWQAFSFSVVSKGSAFMLQATIAAAGWCEFDDILVVKSATVMTKNTIDSHGGSRHLRVSSDTVLLDGDMESTVDPVELPGFGVWITTQPDHGPDQPDASLVASYRMFDNGDTDVANIAAKQYLVDGDMEAAGVAAWTVGVGAPTLSKQVVTPQSGLQCLRIAAAVFSTTTQSILTTGKTYRIKGFARGDGTSTPSLDSSFIPGDLWLGTTSTAWQPFDVTFVALGSIIALQKHLAAGAYVEFDSVHVSEVPQLVDGDCERAETLLADGDCEAAGVGSWTGTAGTTSKQTTDPYSGKSYLRITADAAAGAQVPRTSQNLMTVSADYRIKGAGRSDGTEIPILKDGSTVLWTGTNSTSWQPFDIPFTASSVNFQMRFEITGPAGTEYIEFDDLELTLVDTSLLDDYTMDADNVTDWTAGNSATLTKQNDDSAEGIFALRVAYNAVNDPYASQAKLVIGVEYRAVGKYRGNGSDTASILHGVTNIITSTTSALWQPFDVTFTATATDLRLQSDTTGAGYAEFDNVVLTPTGNVMNWVTGVQSVLSKQVGRRDNGVGASVLRVTTTAISTSANASQDILTSMEYYRVTGWAKGDGVALPKVAIGGSTIWTGTADATWQRVDAVGAVAATLLVLLCGGGPSGDEYSEFDDMAVSPVLMTAPATNSGATSVDTELGPALDFDGSDSIDAGTGFNALTAVTVSGWFEFDDVTTNQWLWNKYLSSTDAYGLRLHNGTLKIFDDIDNAGAELYSTAVAISTRYHAVVVLNAALENKLYINGVLVGSGTVSTGDWASFAGSLYMGQKSPAVNPFDGRIESTVDIYQEAKDQTWVTAEYARGLAAIDSYVYKSTIGPRGQLRQLTVGQNEVSQKVLVIGATYNVTASAKSHDGVNVPRFRSGSTVWWTGTTNLLWQDATANFVADSEFATLENGRWDNVVITRVLGNDVPAAAERDQIIAQQYYLAGWYRTDGVSKFRIKDGAVTAHELAAADDWTAFAKTWLTTEDTLKLSIDKLSGYLELDDLTLAYGDGTIP